MGGIFLLLFLGLEKHESWRMCDEDEKKRYVPTRVLKQFLSCPLCGIIMGSQGFAFN